MTPTVTIPLADYLMLKEDNKKLQEAADKKGKFLRIDKNYFSATYVLFEEHEVIEQLANEVKILKEDAIKNKPWWRKIL